MTEGDAIIVYDFAQLEKKSANEYWFKTSPMEAALLIFTVEEEADGEAADTDDERE
jgi:hypothetical protein